MNIPFLKPNITQKDIQSVARVLKSGWLATGPELGEFEERFADYLGIPNVIANSSGTAALHTALLAAGVGPGDEVITTPLTFWATSNVILFVGATPVFVDVEPDTGLISTDAVAKAITKRTKAIIPVHLYGQMADMGNLAKIAKQYRIKIIEDACHAIESERDDIRPGDMSFAACFSFHAAKNITAGEGGAVAVHTKSAAKQVRLFNDSGSDRSGKIRHMPCLGYKYSMTNMQGALLTNQLARIDREWIKRKKIYDSYVKGLHGLQGVTLLHHANNIKHAYHMFTFIVPQAIRDAVRSRIRQGGVMADIHYNPVHLEPYYRKLGYKKGMFPEAERIGLGTITLPLYTRLSQNEISFVIETTRKAILSK